MRIAIHVIDYPTLNAGISLYRSLSKLGHRCFLVEAQYGRSGDMKRRTPVDIPTVMFILRLPTMARKNRIAWVMSQQKKGKKPKARKKRFAKLRKFLGRFAEYAFYITIAIALPVTKIFGISELRVKRWFVIFRRQSKLYFKLVARFINRHFVISLRRTIKFYRLSIKRAWRKLKKSVKIAKKNTRLRAIEVEEKYFLPVFQEKRRKVLRYLKRKFGKVKNVFKRIWRRWKRFKQSTKNKISEKRTLWRIRINGWYSLNPVNLYRYLTFSKRARPTNRYWIDSIWHSTLVQIFDHGFAKKCELVQAENVLKAHNVDVAIMTHDIETSITVPFFKACRKNDIPVFLYPYSFPEPEATYRRFKEDKTHIVNNKQKTFIARYWPEYVWQEDGNQVLYSPVPQTVASIIGGLSLPRPWFVHSSHFDKVFLQSKFFRQQYQGNNFSTKNMSITGAPEHDAFYAVQSNKKFHKKQFETNPVFDAGKPVLGVNVGQNAFAGGNENSPLFNSWKSFAKYQKSQLKKLSKRFNIILSFHPRIPEQERKSLMDKQFIVAECGVIDVLAMSDMLLTYSGSSVIPYGIAGQIPVLIYDVHGYHYDTIFDEPGVRVVYENKQLENMIDKILATSEIKPLFDLSPNAINDNKGVIDGQAGKRIEKILFEYV